MGTFSTIINLIPSLIAMIKAIEEAVPGQGAGKQKLDAVLETVTSIDSSLTEHVGIITTVIGSLVKLFNVTGAFTAPTSTATPAPAPFVVNQPTSTDSPIQGG